MLKHIPVNKPVAGALRSSPFHCLWARRRKSKSFCARVILMGVPFHRKIISVIEVLLGTKSCFMLIMTCFCMFRYTFSTLTTNTILYSGQ